MSESPYKADTKGCASIFILRICERACFRNPDILTVHDIGESAGRQFIATEFVEEETLRQHMEGTPMAVGEALEVTIQVASALAAAHRAGIVHQDCVRLRNKLIVNPA